MPIESALQDGIIFTELSGEVNYNMVVQYMDRISSLKGKVIDRYELHDHTNTEILNFSADDIRNIAAYSEKTRNIFKHSFLAVYAPNDLTFGMARMFQTFYEMEKNPMISEIFRKREDAIQFLKNKMKSMATSGINE